MLSKSYYYDPKNHSKKFLAYQMLVTIFFVCAVLSVYATYVMIPFIDHIHVLIVVCVWLTFLPIMWFYIWKHVRRLKDIELTCSRITRGHYEAKCDSEKKDILTPVCENINTMIQVITEQIEHQKLTVQAISHDVKTPLARMRFSMEMLEKNESNAKYLEALEEDLTEIDKLINDMRYFCYVDSGNGRQHFETVCVSSAINQILKQRCLHLRALQITLHVRDNLSIDADPMTFTRVMNNLILNAARYAKKHIDITVSYDPLKRSVLIQVDDDGCGIPKDKRSDVFKPFVVLDKTRSTNQRCCGLGLAIADRAMKVHGGSISISDAPLGGARITTFWPISHESISHVAIKTAFRENCTQNTQNKQQKL